jgi:thioredoxin 1
MSGVDSDDTPEPTRDAIDQLPGPVVLYFGARWCGYCRAADPAIGRAAEAHPHVTLVRIEDGPGRPLGRSFAVKLWPTLVFLRDGLVKARLVRPENTEIAAAFEAIANQSNP